MKRRLFCSVFAVVAVLVWAAGERSARASESDLEALVAEFEAHAEVALVFTKKGLPSGNYYDVMKELSPERRFSAARIALREAKKYPRGYLGGAGLRAIGVFDSLVSRTGDGFRPYDKRLKGYRYYGLWNGKSALVAAYYTGGQLPLTLHHEVFHHLDATRSGKTDYGRFFTADDGRFAKAVKGSKRYPAPRISKADLAALKKRSRGYLLRTAVSEYATKSAGEDQAETARYFMTSLPDALVQVVERPNLPGSQRILHVIEQYRRATADGPGIDWFVDVALGRRSEEEGTRAFPENPYSHEVDAKVRDPVVRAAIRRAQPAAVRLDIGSGVNLDSGGRILTAAHVAKKLGVRMGVLFPDGRRFQAECTAIDHDLDLAVLAVSDGAASLPSAHLAPRAPKTGDAVIAVGQPGRLTPDCKSTGYRPFHVSVGKIRGFLPDRLGSQRLGRTKHDAWTYWGHSGSPIFDTAGRIVAMHNSWDSRTAMRHAVTYEAIIHFLDENHIPYRTRD